MDKQNQEGFNPSDWNEPETASNKKIKKGEKSLIDANRMISAKNENSMKTLLEKHCPNNAHHPDIIKFASACNSVGIQESECRDFLHQNSFCISSESSHYNNPKKQGKEIADIYSRYSGEFGKYKNADLQTFIPKVPNRKESDPQDEINLPNIPLEVYEALPDILKEACNILTDQVEKEVFLLGALGFLSGCMPNVWMYYDGHKVETNLFVFITTRAGGGKGSLKFAYLLAKDIHERKREEYEKAVEAYKQEMKLYRKDLKDNPDLEEPEYPKNRMLIIPANSSATGAIELMDDNDGRVILFETEGDTLANTFKTDYGNYSDCLRKAFHHERISYYRRKDKEFVEIDQPYLTAIFSSTFDQLLKLIPDAENGLFSRFLFYEVKPSMKFKKVKDRRKNGYEESFRAIGKRVEELYDMLSNEKPIEIYNTEEQDERFYEIFQRWKYEVNEFVSEDLDGTVNRLGLIFHRIMMIFTVLRIQESGEYAHQYQCSDHDFDNAFRLIEVLKNHAIHIYRKLPSTTESKNLNSEMKRKVYEALPDEFHRKEVEQIVKDTGMNERTFTRFLKTELFSRIKQGHYRKSL